MRRSVLRRCGFVLFAITSLVFASHSGTFAGVTRLDVYSEPGEGIGRGGEQHFSAADGSFTIEHYSGDNAIVVHFSTPTYSHFWDLAFAAPQTQLLAVGTYTGARRYPFQGPSTPGLAVYGDGGGCNTDIGDFQVKQVTYSASGEVLAFWAVFGQHCEGSLPALNGEIRYNADLTLAVGAPGSKWVERGNPLVFDVTTWDASGASVALSASGLPDDATFTDHGNGTGTFRWVPRQFGATTVTFEGRNTRGGVDRTVTQVAVVPSTFLVIRVLSSEGVPGYHHFTPRTGWFSWGVNWANGLTAHVGSSDFTEYWSLDFAAADGSPLAVGTYPEAQRFPLQQSGHPGMEVGGGCNTSDGRFDVTGVTYSSPDQLARFHATFDQLCVESGLRLSGELALNADVKILLTVPDERTVTETDHLTVDVSALDVDDRALVLSASGVPVGASFQDLGEGVGRLTWVPAEGQAGRYLVCFQADDAGGATSSLCTLITVDRLNHPPVARAGGPYEGIVGIPVTFDGRGSVDPDVEPLYFYWDLADGSALGPTPSHTYASPGVYDIALYVSDGVSISTEETTLTIREPNGPDLVGTWRGLSGWCAGPKTTTPCFVSGVFEVANAGNAGAPKSRLSYYLSEDPALDGADELLHSDRVSALSAGEARVGRLMARLPVGVSLFGRYVIAVVDATGDVAETRELNNRVPSGPISAQSTDGLGVRRGGR